MDSAFSSADELVRNGELRTELAPYADESLTRVDTSGWTTEKENQYFASMLVWEKAPSLPVYKWFEPALIPPPVWKVSDEELPRLLNDLVNKLYEKNIVLDYTDHLSDRELYEIIVHKILPQDVKKTDQPDVYHHWDCSRIGDCDDELEDSRIWLTYYADDKQREESRAAYGDRIPQKQIPSHHRDFPKDDSVHY